MTNMCCCAHREFNSYSSNV